MTRMMWFVCLVVLSAGTSCDDGDSRDDPQGGEGEDGVNGDPGDPGDPSSAEGCHESAENWPADWTEMEEAVFDLINARRIAGDSCNNGANVYPPGEPLEMNPALWCAARVHSLWMAENQTMSHDSPGGPLGDTPQERFDAVGYSGWGWAENVAMGQSTPEQVVQTWMDSTAGHCDSIMGDYAIIGVGYAFTDADEWGGHYWTLDFGS